MVNLILREPMADLFSIENSVHELCAEKLYYTRNQCETAFAVCYDRYRVSDPSKTSYCMYNSR